MFPKEKAWLLSFVLMVRSFQNHLKSNTQSRQTVSDINKDWLIYRGFSDYKTL